MDHLLLLLVTLATFSGCNASLVDLGRKIEGDVALDIAEDIADYAKKQYPQAERNKSSIVEHKIGIEAVKTKTTTVITDEEKAQQCSSKSPNNVYSE